VEGEGERGEGKMDGVEGDYRRHYLQCITQEVNVVSAHTYTEQSTYIYPSIHMHIHTYRVRSCEVHVLEHARCKYG
jgi:hypothetical protein